MRVLVTGATGFLGSHVTRRLVSEGCTVSALVRPGADTRRIADVLSSITLIAADLMGARGSVAASLAGLHVDACVHLAWFVKAGAYISAPENLQHVTASLELFEALRGLGCGRVVGAGTCFEYDLETAALALSETSPIRPRTLYAACKHAVATIGEQSARLAGMSWGWGRIFYPYGPGDDPAKLIPTLIADLRAGRPCALTSGVQVRDYIHVEDVASAFWALLRSSHEGALAIGSGEPVTIAQMARTVGDLLGRPDLLQLGARAANPGDPAHVCADNRALHSLGWQRRFDLAGGIADTVARWTG